MPAQPRFQPVDDLKLFSAGAKKLLAMLGPSDYNAGINHWDAFSSLMARLTTRHQQSQKWSCEIRTSFLIEMKTES